MLRYNILAPNIKYAVYSNIKIHTKPLKYAITIQNGRFVRESDMFLIFDKFRVKKINIVQIKELYSEV